MQPPQNKKRRRKRRRFWEQGSLDGGAERDKSELRELEALLAEGDTDDGDAPNDPRKEKADAEFKTAEDQPDHVGDRVLAEVGLDVRAHGPDRDPRQFEALLAEGDADDGNTPDNTRNEPRERHFKAGEDEPEYVTDRFHAFFLSYVKIIYVKFPLQSKVAIRTFVGEVQMGAFIITRVSAGGQHHLTKIANEM